MHTVLFVGEVVQLLKLQRIGLRSGVELQSVFFTCNNTAILGLAKKRKMDICNS